MANNTDLVTAKETEFTLNMLRKIINGPKYEDFDARDGKYAFSPLFLQPVNIDRLVRLCAKKKIYSSIKGFGSPDKYEPNIVYLNQHVALSNCWKSTFSSIDSVLICSKVVDGNHCESCSEFGFLLSFKSFHYFFFSVPPVRAKIVREWSYFLSGKVYNVSCQVQGSNPSAYTKAKVGPRELKVSDFEVKARTKWTLLEPLANSNIFRASCIILGISNVPFFTFPLCSIIANTDS